MERASRICACGDHCWIPLTQGYVALADAEFAPAVGLWKWFAKPDGRRVYAARTYHQKIGGKDRGVTIRMHHMVMPVSTYLVDHKNMNGLDNRKSNLRLATPSDNSQNGKARQGSMSRFRGVTWRGGKWAAVITKSGRQEYLGTFATEEAAARAYDQAAQVLHGQFARPNFENRETA